MNVAILHGMKIILLIPLIYSFGLQAAPIEKSSKDNRTLPVTVILKQIHQINDDGSYTFGYESEDGTYRVENRDNAGYVIGKYGYLNAAGELHEIEYVAGKYGDRTVGYQAKSPLIPIISRNSKGTFPVLRPETVSQEQKARDYEYNSVDENEDGIPDSPPNRGKPAKDSKSSNTRPSLGRSSASQSVKTVGDQPSRSPIVKVNEAADPRVGTINFLEIAKTIAEPSTVEVTTLSSRKPLVIESRQTATQIPVISLKIASPTNGETKPSGLPLSGILFSDNLMTAESKIATKEIVQEPTVFEDQNVQRAVTTGRLDQFLRDLVARSAVKTEAYPSSNPTFLVAPAAASFKLPQDNSVDAETLGYTRII